MELGTTVLFKTTVMFILMIVGLACYKTKIISAQTNRGLSSLIATVVNPILIFMSYQTKLNSQLINGLLYAFLFSAISYAIALTLSYVLIRKKENPNCGIERMAVVYSNCGFIGIPLISSIFGAEGVVYLSAYMTFFNVFIWTHGVLTIKGEREKGTLKKIFTAPGIIASIVGLIMLATGFILPPLASEPLTMLSDLNTPLAMIVAGVTIAQTNMLAALKKPRLYLTSLLRLFVVPLITYFVLIALFGTPTMSMMTVVIASACPIGAMCTLFAINYGKDEKYSAELFAFTTIFSCVTLPLLVTLFT